MPGACPEEAARPARPEDRFELEQLRDEARQAVAPNRGGAALIGRDHPRETVDAVVQSGIDGDPDTAVLVGTLDGMTVGFLIADRSVSDTPGEDDSPEDEPVARIHEVWVTPGARGLGVGEELIGAVLDWARKAGCVAIDADALPGDRETKNFFERHGLVARSIRVSRQLG